MKWFRGRTAAKSAKAAPSAGKVESVVLYYGLTGDGFGTEAEREAVFALETRLDEVLQPEALGEVDGNEFGGGEASVYVYGPDCTRAWQAMEAEARRLPLRPAHVVLETTTGDRRRIDLAPRGARRLDDADGSRQHARRADLPAQDPGRRSQDRRCDGSGNRGSDREGCVRCRLKLDQSSFATAPISSAISAIVN